MGVAHSCLRTWGMSGEPKLLDPPCEAHSLAPSYPTHRDETAMNGPLVSRLVLHKLNTQSPPNGMRSACERL